MNKELKFKILFLNHIYKKKNNKMISKVGEKPQKKEKKQSPNNSNNSSNDENLNSLNNNIINTESKITSKAEQANEEQKKRLQQLQSLTYLFPFLKEEQNNNDNENVEKKTNKNYTISEYNKIVASINKGNSKDEEEILTGKVNIIDKVIKDHMPISNDLRVASIQPNMTVLSLKVGRNFNMLNDIGYRLPNLIELDLQGSEIDSIMDIGISFNKLEKLNVSNCGLTELSGIICFKNLKELIASHNKIEDLIDVEMCEELKFLDVSYNLLSDESCLLFLNSCPKLEKIIIMGNNLKTFDKSKLNDFQIIA